MAIINAVEGQTINLVESFVDVYDDPLDLANTEPGPIVELRDSEKNLIAEGVGVPYINGQPGEWAVEMAIPIMGITNTVELTAHWSFKEDNGDSVRTRQDIYVSPAVETRVTDIVIVKGRSQTFELPLPFAFVPGTPAVPADVAAQKPAIPEVPGDTLKFFLYNNNVDLYPATGLDPTEVSSNIMYVNSSNKSTFRLPVVSATHILAPMTLIAEYKDEFQMSPTLYTFKLWMVTPSVLGAASQIEDFINKAKIANVIPALDYTQADLVQYLHRGLGLFNSLGTRITAFTGMNMQGPILDAWLTCSSYYALASQLQAEGALAFDFSGQTVNLNIDRTPAIESALGRVESAIESQVKPLKNRLVKVGVLDGDGSAGGQFIDGSRHLGRLGIINAPTSRIGYGRRGSWFQPLF